MSIKEISVKINGISPLLMHNPQTVDRFNPYTKRMAQINAKKKNRTDEDYRELASIEMASSLYFDTNLGVYVPTRWILSAYAKHSFSIGKVSKANVRRSVFTLQDNVKLHYAQMDKVKESIDVVNNSFFPD